MGILMGIISFFLGLAVNLLDAAVEAMLNSIGYDISTFLAMFPFAQNAADTFTACALAFLALGLMWQAFKGLGAPFGIEYENPLHIFAKVALAWFAVVNLTQILDILTGFFKIVLNDLNNQALNPTHGAEDVVDGLMSNLVFGLLDTATGGLLGIVYIIFAIVLGWKFVKLLIELVERYIVYCFICLIGPVFVATAAFKSSKNIADTWLRAFFGQSLLILLNTWSAKMFLSYMQLFLQNLGGVHVSGVGIILPLVMLFFGFAFLNFASRIDSFLRILGLNTAHTGAGMAQSMLGGVTRLMIGVKSLQNAGGLLSGAAAAAKEAGGFGSPAGIKAAASSILGGMKGPGGGGGQSAASTIGGISSKDGGVGTNRRADGSKADADAPGRRAGMGTPPSGSLLRQEASPGDQIMAGQREIKSALNSQGNPNAENGIGATNSIGGKADKADYTDGGVLASAGRQGEVANQFHGGNKPMGAIKQDGLTANAVRAAATSAERAGPGGGGKPIASYEGQEAAAAMNGVLAFGNENLQGFQYAEEADGTGGISGMNFQDGSSVTFDGVSGGIASGVYTDADGNSTAFDMVHDNAVESMAASGSSGGIEFDRGAAVGRVGDGSGDKGFYVVPKAASGADAGTTPYGHSQTYARMGATVNRANSPEVQRATENLNRFIGNCNPVDKPVTAFTDSRLEQMQKSGSGSMPMTKYQKNSAGKL